MCTLLSYYVIMLSKGGIIMEEFIGKRIKKYRKKENLTQAELAERIDKSLRSVQKYEAGDVAPGIDVVDKIAEALGISRNALLIVKRSYRPDKSLEMVYDLFEEVFNHSRIKEEIGLTAKEFMEKDQYFIFQLREEFIQSIILNSRFLKQKVLNENSLPMEEPLKICPYSNKVYELGNKLNNKEYLRYMRDKYDRLLNAVTDHDFDNHKTLEKEAQKSKGKYDDQGENDYRFATQDDIDQMMGR